MGGQLERLELLVVRELPGMLTDKAIQAVVDRRPVAEVKAALKAPRRAQGRRMLREAAQDGWTAGLLEGEAQAALVTDDQLREMALRHMAREDRFDESDADRLAAMRARVRRRRGRMPKLPGSELKVSPPMSKVMREEWRRIEASIKARTAEYLKQSAAELRRIREFESPEAVAQRLEALRRGGKPARDAVAQMQLDTSGAIKGVEEVDWQVFQQGQVARGRVEKTITAYQFVSRGDLKVTCICQILDGNVISTDDPEMMEYSPRLHYNCRCTWWPRTVADRAELTWDDVRSYVIGEPTAGDRKVSVSIAPRQIDIPDAAPSVAPPKRCQEWFNRSRKAPAGVEDIPDQEQAERDYLKQLEDSDDDRLKRIIRSERLKPGSSKPAGPEPHMPSPPKLTADDLRRERQRLERNRRRREARARRKQAGG